MRQSSDEQIATLRGRLAELIRGPYALGDISFDYPGASFGIIYADPNEISPDEALRAADGMMYVQKSMRKAALTA